MANTLRISDSTAEVEIGKFLDRRFYPTNTTNLARFNDLEHQMSGVDVKFDYADRINMLVDEKAAAHYVNKDLPTFAFEMDFLLSSGQLVNGWFFDKNKLTQYYLLAWVWATKDKGFVVDDITKLEIFIISRRSIFDMLARHGLTQEKAMQLSKEIRTKGNAGAHYRSDDKPYYFFYSPQLAEKPVNLIIKKSMLKKLFIGQHEIIK